MADYDGDDTLVATYNTPGLDSNLTKKIGANVYFYLKDGQRSIRNLLDSDETAQNTYDYKAFGSVYGSPTENITNRYRYTSREWESVLDLYFSRARMYDPKLGRFLVRDPLSGGCCGNSYSYVCSSPMLFSDPLGLYTALFKGWDKAEKKKRIRNLLIVNAYNTLIDFNEPAEYYEHRQIKEAFNDVKAHVEEYKNNNCHYPEINVVGYSCGSDSALALVHKIANWIDNENIKGLILRNLIYVDFNWGTAHADECRHGTDSHYDPRIAAKVWHFVSSGEMDYGCQKNPKHKFYNPTCSIDDHTWKMWDRWPDPDDGKNWWELFLIQLKVGTGLDGIVNTSGIATSTSLSSMGWPSSYCQHMGCWKLDHYQLGDAKDVGKQVAGIIIRHFKPDYLAQNICFPF